MYIARRNRGVPICRVGHASSTSITTQRDSPIECMQIVHDVVGWLINKHDRERTCRGNQFFFHRRRVGSCTNWIQAESSGRAISADIFTNLLLVSQWYRNSIMALRGTSSTATIRYPLGNPLRYLLSLSLSLSLEVDKKNCSNQPPTISQGTCY